MRDAMIAALGIAFAGFCLRLVVRLAHRGWRPDRRFWIAAPFALMLSYPLSFGPACWVTSRITDRCTFLTDLYWPLIACLPTDDEVETPYYHMVDWYSSFAAADRWCWYREERSPAAPKVWVWGRIPRW